MANILISLILQAVSRIKQLKFPLKKFKFHRKILRNTIVLNKFI